MLSSIDIHTVPAPAAHPLAPRGDMPVFAGITGKTANDGRFALASRCAS